MEFNSISFSSFSRTLGYF